MNDPASANGFGRDKVVKIISSVLSKVSEAEEISRESLYKDLKDLQDIIHDARKEISFARPSDIQDKHIPTATDELDLIVKSTEEATSSIMDSCEILEQEADKEGGPSAFVVSEEVTKIYEACSFQDITGQRITKVIKALQEIDIKISALLGETTLTAEMSQPQQADIDKPETLLNGPQMSDQAITQDDIDALLASFND